MNVNLKALFVDAATAFYQVNRYPAAAFCGPVDLGLHLSLKHNSLNIGTGLLAGSIIPGSNRLVFTGISPCWQGFYISSMGGAGLVFDNLGINMLTLVGKAPTPSVLYLNRDHGQEIQVEISPIDIWPVWQAGEGGIFSLMQQVMDRYGHRYDTDPRILATGPASAVTDMGAICSVPIKDGRLGVVDTWAGRGGMGTKLFQEHGIAAVIYGGSFIDEDFRDRKVADQWFTDKYQMKLAAKDVEATTKYRFDPKFKTGGTFGVNFANLGGAMFSFNYKSIYMPEAERQEIHERFILGHYLRQFNEETIGPKKQKNCGEPCAAVCKKLHGKYKKDYEPYQTMGPLSGIFDQRAAESLNHHANGYGFDAISVGGVLSWLMEALDDRLISPEELGISSRPAFRYPDFDLIQSSAHNACVGMALLDAMIEGRGCLDLSKGARHLAERLARDKGREILDRFVFSASGDRGWMVPNQYWTPGVFTPMAIMGKYYMHYGQEVLPPRELGKKAAERLLGELIMDNLGVCRFHRVWAEEMLPEIMDSLYGLKSGFLAAVARTAKQINSRNTSVFWESRRTTDIVHLFLKRKQEALGKSAGKDLDHWLQRFETDKRDAAVSFWYEMHRGIQEHLQKI